MCVSSYAIILPYVITLICWCMRGRIKEKIDTIYAIKHQVYSIANTAQWSANTVLLLDNGMLRMP